MFARYHGERTAARHLIRPASVMAGVITKSNFQAGMEPQPTRSAFDTMFPALDADPDNFLPEGPETIAALRSLGASMAADPSKEESPIPAAYTYFGQFIDHDITKTAMPDQFALIGDKDVVEADDFPPLSREQMRQFVTNDRSAQLDLDSVYGGLAAEAATNPDGSMVLGTVSNSGFFPVRMADRQHDLPRRPLIPNPANDAEQAADREALIGDPRNDENLLVAQLHLAFLRSHNTILQRDAEAGAAGAKSAMRRRYQWAVLHDFLRRVCKNTVIEDVLANGPSFLKVEKPGGVFMPVEFAAAAYRFGHSMVRQEYDHNTTFGPPPAPRPATFNFMFTFTALSGDLSPGPGPSRQFPTLPDNWPIDWVRFFDGPGGAPTQNPARKIDTRLALELGRLPDVVGEPITTLMAQLATRNLLRGYRFKLPTGQAVARAMGLAPLEPDTLSDAVVQSGRRAFEDAGFHIRTPLWFYVLAEAGDPNGTKGDSLGDVGSRIVAETLWTLVKHSPDSVLVEPPTAEELATGEFTLKGLVRIGQDTGMTPLAGPAASAAAAPGGGPA